MPELRQDPITRDWVIVNPERAQRPQPVAGPAHDAAATCPFCPGREHATPPEIERIEDAHGSWRVRVIPNRFAALAADAAVPETYGHTAQGWHRLAGYGHHEVIVETPEHDASAATMNEGQWHRVLVTYLRRYRALSAAPGVRQVVLFRNHGRRAGTSLEHPHAQIVATPVVSPEVRWRLSQEIGYYDANGCCGLCDVMARESQSGERIIHAGASFISIAPYASRVPYHMQIVPRRHMPAFSDIEDLELIDLASHLRDVLRALHNVLGDPDYNLVVVSPPLDQVHRQANHWFIDIVPRLTTPAGFELGSRMVVIAKPPEAAAAELRGGMDTSN